MEAFGVGALSRSSTGDHEPAPGCRGPSRRELGPRVDGRVAAGGGEFLPCDGSGHRARCGEDSLGRPARCAVAPVPRLSTYPVAPAPSAAPARTDGADDMVR